MPSQNSNLDTLHTLADNTVAHAKARVTCVFWDNRKVWIKKPLHKCVAKLCRNGQRLISLFIPAPVLRPILKSGGISGLETESARIAQFSNAGFIVPRVIAVTPQWVALSDTGETLAQILKNDPGLTIEKLRHTVCEAASTLATLHKNSLAHGCCSLENITQMPDGRIGFINLDHDLDHSNIPLSALMARDVYTFILSTAGFAHIDTDICGLAFITYKNTHDNNALLSELGKLLSTLSSWHKISGVMMRHENKKRRRISCALAALTPLV